MSYEAGWPYQKPVPQRQPNYCTNIHYARARTTLMGWSRRKVDEARREIEWQYSQNIPVDPHWEKAVREAWDLHCMSPWMEYGGNLG